MVRVWFLLAVVLRAQANIGGRLPRVYNGPALIGTTNDKMLYTKSYSNRQWDGPVENGCCMMRIAVMQDGSLLGVGEDNQLYTKTSIYVGSWKVVENSCCIQDVTVDRDGTIIGVSSTSTRKLMTRSDLTGQWTTSNKFNDVIRIDVLPDGTILGVTPTGGLKRRVGGVEGGLAFQKSFGMKVDDISIQPDGTVLGIEKGGCGVHVFDLEAGKWGDELPESKCVTAISSPGNLVIIEPTEKPTTAEPTDAPTEAPTEPPTEPPTVAPTEAPPPPSKYQVFTDKVENKDAYGECYKKGMMLAVPTDESAYNGIVNAIKAMGTLDTEFFWFGLRYFGKDVKTIYGSDDYYRAFAPNEPSGTGECVVISVKHGYKYDDVYCGNNAYGEPDSMYICEPLDPAFASQMAKYKVFTSRTSHDKAIAKCKKRGMVLAKDYNEWIHAAITLKVWSLGEYWVSLYIDAKHSGGSIVSSDGSRQNFKPFAEGEMDANGPCIYIRRNKDWLWADQKCKKTFGFVCYDKNAKAD